MPRRKRGFYILFRGRWLLGYAGGSRTLLSSDVRPRRFPTSEAAEKAIDIDIRVGWEQQRIRWSRQQYTILEIANA